ncbi:selenide, water dikinase SelD [Vibrio mediterranei]
MSSVRLTQFSHGGGCGCKISPQVLKEILATQMTWQSDPHLLVGNETSDDAAVYDIGNGQSIISTTDFFMPIVDTPRDFGRIAAANAISDIYAMGGKPLMAIAILGWPINKLSTDIAQQVIEGGRAICAEAGISLAGGHSIDTPEPIFGLAVTGIISTERIKKNSGAQDGDMIFVTKPFGIGMLSHAEKKGKLLPADSNTARDWMCRLNQIGQQLSSLDGIHAMTDVTGFGLLGHLIEMCEGANVNAQIESEQIPKIADLNYYFEQDCVPGGTGRNFASYGGKVSPISEIQKAILCDPQTSGGLMIAVAPSETARVAKILNAAKLHSTPIGRFIKLTNERYTVYVS